MAAMAGATSGRAWLAMHVPYLADPKRMRRATVGLMVAATLVSSVGLQGSAAPPAHAAVAAAHAR
jgi:hypothetical protein